MAMRLLSPSQGKSRRELDIHSQELRITELDGLIERKRLELQQLDRDMVRALSEKGAERFEEDEKWKQKIHTLTEEVIQLEARKKRALVPLEEKEKELDTRDSALSKREETVKIKESDLEYTKKALEDKLDAVSEREVEANEYAATLSNREYAIKMQEDELKSRMNALTTILQESFTDIQKAHDEAAKHKAILKGRDITLAERERKVAEIEKTFDDRDRAITDRYRTLMRAITEVNLKDNVTKQDPTLGTDK